MLIVRVWDKLFAFTLQPSPHSTTVRRVSWVVYVVFRNQFESSLRRQMLVSNSSGIYPCAGLASGPDGLCTYFNSGWLQFTGRTFEESLGNGWLSDVHPNDSKRVMNEYTQALRARSQFRLEYRLKNKCGRYKWIVDFGGPVFGSNGSFQGYIGSCTDAFDPHCSGRETHWRQKYELALADSGRGDLPVRIASAEIAIRERFEQVLDAEEQSMLRECLATLLALKQDLLGFLDGERGASRASSPVHRQRARR
jgi:PAS domain S-box-containing protein